MTPSELQGAGALPGHEPQAQLKAQGKGIGAPEGAEGIDLVPQFKVVFRAAEGEDGLLDGFRSFRYLYQGKGIGVIEPFIGLVHSGDSF